MPLSEHEQRLFEQIEKSLAEDPKFASAVRSTDPRFHARRRMVVAGVVVLAGLGVVVLGAVRDNTLLGVAGFVIMMLASGFAIQSRRRAQGNELRAVDGTASRQTGQRSSGGFIARLEARWRDRPESR
ncbi:hypothetical protein F4553_002770 [Allocatelliglobosispora scoriae]|uniref:DUF3040 domain-containing protein n=1 Tax=Allocatelliglobosispora scoriae TaxID=643052 RepID=A0A841BRG3_9ACTN|nr:DUF3040 domain-containing protein [Allocatelliglobosispora scoriae]MBB5869391.1 hypothetical protein [Allocatelliglobosispora scoriae]